MESNEIEKQLSLSYADLVEYLLLKYGRCLYNYFSSPLCKSQNQRAKRTDEGLVIHHIDEDKAIMLSDPEHAAKNPLSYQHSDRLVYCNILEHLILHIKIVEEPRHPKANADERLGIGGIKNYLCPEINDYFNGKQISEWQLPVFKQIENNFEEYIYIIKYFLDLVDKNAELKVRINKHTISCGRFRKIAERVFLAVNKAEIFCAANKNDNQSKEEILFKSYNSSEESAIIQYCLGYCYFYGLGVTADAEEAFKWFGKAAKENKNAKLFLDKRKELSAEKMKKNTDILEFDNLKKSAESGDPEAQYNLFFRYNSGRGVKADRSRALQWLKKSAEAGYARAQWYLGNEYIFGASGLKADKNEALRWFKLSAEQGYQMGIEAYKRYSGDNHG